MFCVYFFYLTIDLYRLIISKIVVTYSEDEQVVSKRLKNIVDQVSDLLFILSRIQIK